MKRLLVFVSLQLLFSFSCLSQNFVEVPDEGVRSAIEDETGVSFRGSDGKVGYYDTTLLKVVKLDLRYRSIKSLRGISYCKNLEILLIGGASWGIAEGAQPDFNELSGLVNLDSLNVTSINLSYLDDFSFLNKLINLRYVSFYECGLSNFNRYEVNNKVPLSLVLEKNYLDNDDISNFFKIDKLKYLNLGASNVRPSQSFSKERIDTLFVLHPELIRVSYVVTPTRYIHTRGTTEYVTCTDLDTVGADHYFCRYDTKYDRMFFPGGADVYKKNGDWYIKPRKGIEMKDTARRTLLLDYANQEFRCDSYMLIPNNLLNSDITLYGFGAKIGAVGSNRVNFTLVDLPYPLNVIVDHYLEAGKNSRVLVPSEIEGSVRYDYDVHNPRYSFHISTSYFKLPTFDLKNVSVTYDGIKDEMGGSLTLAIFGGSFEFDTEIKFSKGTLDKLILNVSKEIYLGSTGLKITSIGGGVEDFSGPNWKIRAQGNIESLLTVPVFGAVYSGEELGISVAPFSQFEASGKFFLLKSEIAKGRIAYITRNGCFSISGNVNFGDVLSGTLHSSLSYKQLTGIVTGVIKTPSVLPWSFKYLQNKTIASVVAKIDNNVITTEMDFYGIPLAQKLVFNSASFPYFEYSIGKNLNALTRVLKSTQSQTYTVPDKTPNLMIVAGNDAYLFDIWAKSPTGTRFDRQNAVYLQYPETKQTVLIIRNPEPGDWTIETDEKSTFTYQVLGGIPAPVVEFHPETSNQETDKLLSFTVHNAPERYKVFLYRDIDSVNYDGTEFTSWGYSGSGDQTFNIDLNNHYLLSEDCYVYLKIVDYYKKTPPYFIYAPYKYKGQSNGPIPQEIPILTFKIVSEDTLKVIWDKPSDPTARFIRVYYKKPSELYNTEIIIPQDTNFTYITGLQNNVDYEISAKFTGGSLGFGPSSDTLIINIPSDDKPTNMAPYFLTNAQDSWEFYTDSLSSYVLRAVDKDDDPIFFKIIDDTLGITLSDSIFSWKPKPFHTGEYNIPVVVSDNELADTLLKRIKVIDKTLASVSLTASSYSFVVGNTIAIELTDANLSGNSVQVQLLHPDSGTDSLFSLYRIDRYHFLGAIPINDTLFQKLKIKEGDKVVVNYYTEHHIYSINLTAKYNATPLDINQKKINDHKVFVSPNPAHDFITIHGVSDCDSYIFDASGKYVFHYKGKQGLPVSHLKRGIYFLVVKTGNKNYHLTFLKQ